jgi:anti-anti-sigma factor
VARRGPIREEFALATDAVGDARILRVSGDIDLATAPRLGVHAGELIRNDGCDVVVDLREATAIDSTAMGVLLNVCRRATRAGLGFAVICPDGPLRRPLEIARLLDTLRVQRTESDALRCVERVREAGRARRDGMASRPAG